MLFFRACAGENLFPFLIRRLRDTSIPPRRPAAVSSIGFGQSAFSRKWKQVS